MGRGVPGSGGKCTWRKKLVSRYTFPLGGHVALGLGKIVPGVTQVFDRSHGCNTRADSISRYTSPAPLIPKNIEKDRLRTFWGKSDPGEKISCSGTLSPRSSRYTFPHGVHVALGLGKSAPGEIKSCPGTLFPRSSRYTFPYGVHVALGLGKSARSLPPSGLPLLVQHRNHPLI